MAMLKIGRGLYVVQHVVQRTTGLRARCTTGFRTTKKIQRNRTTVVPLLSNVQRTTGPEVVTSATKKNIDIEY